MADNSVWTQLFDYSQSAGGWSQNPAFTLGQYRPGIGWESDIQNRTDRRDVDILINANPSGPVTLFRMTYNLTRGNYTAGAIALAMSASYQNGINLVVLTQESLINGNNQVQQWVGMNSRFTQPRVAINCSALNPPGGLSGDVVITSVLLQGLGANPFVLDDGSECPCSYIGNDVDAARDSVF